MPASAKKYASMTYYLVYRSRTIWRIHPSSSKVGDVHNKPSSRSEDIYDEVISGLSTTVGASLHVVYNALVLARATMLGLVALDAEAVRLVDA